VFQVLDDEYLYMDLTTADVIKYFPGADLTVTANIENDTNV